MGAAGLNNPYPGSMRAATHLFFAASLSAGEQDLDEGEELEVRLVPADEVWQSILDGRYVDFSLQFGVLLARARGLL